MPPIAQVLLAAPPVDGGPSSLELLKKADAFYTTSWNHLLVYTTIWIGFLTILGGVLGFVLPIIIQRAQARLFKVGEEAIINRVRAEVSGDVQQLAVALRAESEAHEKKLTGEASRIEGRVDEMLTASKKDQEASLAEAEKRTSRRLARAEGGVFFIQARLLLQQGAYRMATDSMASAIIGMAPSGEAMNLGRAISNLISNCLPQLTRADFEEDLELEAKINKALGALSPLNEGGVYSDSIAAAKKALQLAKQKPAPQPTKT